MPGTKIINVLRDDTFKDILDLFRRSDAEDVVFVLPKRAKLFRREDHFAAFASESERSSRNISVLCSNPDINDWARKYGFTVIAKGGSASAASADTSDADEEVRDPNTDAFEQDVPVTSDETMGVSDDDEEDEMAGMHVAESDKEEQADETTSDDLDQDLKRYGENDMDQFDEDGNLVAAGGEPVVATLAAQRSLDSLSRAAAQGAQKVKVGARTKPKTEAVAIERVEEPVREPDEEIVEEVASDSDVLEVSSDSKDLFSGGDYIDTVGKEKVAGRPERAESPKQKRRGWFSFGRNDDGASVETRARRRPRTSSRTRSIIIATVVVVLLIAAATILFGFGHASVTVVPVSRDLEFQVTVQASDAFGSVDPLFDKIPGQLFEITKDVKRDFEASGEEEVAAKARGKLVISNVYSSTPQTLIATTRFETPDGLVFRTLQTVSVPGSGVEDGEVVPGQITVDVIADKPGDTYNIEPTTFTISAFREQGLTDRYEQITASSDTAFVGGAVGLSGIVTEEDLADAKTEVTDALRSEIEQAFAAQAGDLELLNGAEVEIDAVVSTAEVDQATDTFTVSATGTLRTVGYRKTDLFTLLEEHVKRNWQLVAVPDQLELLFDNIRFAEDRGILAFDVSAVGKGYLPIDEEQLTRSIRGMNRQEVRDYFRAAENIRASTVILSPIWVRSVPKDVERIELQIDYTAEPEA